MMPPADDRLRKGFLIILVVAITAAFMAMIEGFLMTILVAAIFSGLLHPVYKRILPYVGNRRPLASAATVLLGLVLIGGPLLVVIGLVTNEALRISENVAPRVKEFVSEPSALEHLLQRVPYYDRIEPYRNVIVEKMGEMVGSLGSFLVSSLSDTTKGTVNFIFQFFILLYTMFFLLMDGPSMLRSLLKNLPLEDHEQERMLERFVSVARATLRGTLVIGLIQGVLSGLAFWTVGIDGALFWGTVMVVLSVLPVIGGALGVGTRRNHPGDDGRARASVGADRLLLDRGRIDRQRAAPATGRSGHAVARSVDPLLHAGRDCVLRTDRLPRRTDPRCALRHLVGDFRRRVSRRPAGLEPDPQGRWQVGRRRSRPRRRGVTGLRTHGAVGSSRHCTATAWCDRRGSAPASTARPSTSKATAEA